MMITMIITTITGGGGKKKNDSNNHNNKNHVGLKVFGLAGNAWGFWSVAAILGFTSKGQGLGFGFRV